MALGADGYAPISLPYDIDVLPQYGPPILFNAAVAAGLLPTLGPPPAGTTILAGVTALSLQQQKNQLLENIIQLDTGTATTDRAPVVELVLDTVWWRRLFYFVSLILSLVILAFPLIGSSIQDNATERVPENADIAAHFFVDLVVGLVKGFLPGYAEPWVTALVNSPAPAVFILLLLAATLAFSRFLQRRIRDRSRAAWRVQARVDGATLDRLRLTGQRRAALNGVIIFAAALILAQMLTAPVWLKLVFGFALLASSALFMWRTCSGPTHLDKLHPGFLLSFARRLRTSQLALTVYRYCARTLAPAVFLFACGVLVLSIAHRTSFDLLNATGGICELSDKKQDRKHVVEKIGKENREHLLRILSDFQ